MGFTSTGQNPNVMSDMVGGGGMAPVTFRSPCSARFTSSTSIGSRFCARALTQVDRKEDSIQSPVFHAWQIDAPTTVPKLMTLPNIEVTPQHPQRCIHMRIHRQNAVVDSCRSRF